jgi:SsrA-binding protein
MANPEKETEGIKLVGQNRKARHDFEIFDTFEAGMVLQGSEVKALRAGRINLKDSFAHIRRGEIFVSRVHISPYEASNFFNHEPERMRKLLMNRREIRRLIIETTQKGLTLVPLKVYFKRGRAKIQLGLARGKKQYDKRHTIAKRTADRAMDRAVKEANS